LESWKRKNAELAFKWNMLEFEEHEKTRPEFQGQERTGVWSNGVFVELTVEEGGKKQKAPTSTYFSPFVRIIRTIAGLPAIFVVIICGLGSTLGVVLVRVVLQLIDTNYAVVASIINSVAIILLNVVYSKLAISLNNWENHRTDTDYEDALISKTFAFQFVNSYASLFYIAYFKRRAFIFGEYKDTCKYGDDCIEELTIQLGTILAANIFVGQAQEVGLPYLMNKYKAYDDRKRAAKKQTSLSKEEQKEFSKKLILSNVEKQSNYEPYEGTFGEYSEMIIQYGYVTMFAAAFPLAPLLAFFNNIIEIRSDAFKLLSEIQRPEYKGAQDIGTWYKILNIIGFVAVLTNCLIISITSVRIKDQYFSQLNYYSPCDPTDLNCDVPSLLAAILATIILEHIIILAKFIVSELIPDEPEWVRIELARQNYFKDQILEEEEGDEENKLSAFDDTISAADEEA
jgi:hypothetical protein